MEDGYIGEIRIFAGNFAPSNWYLCDGTKIKIQDNTELFSIIGTTYGGNGRKNFALPDLRGIFPMAPGTNADSGVSYSLGQTGGDDSQVLTEDNLPAHTHALMATTKPGNLNDPTDALLGNTGSFDSEYVITDSDMVQMADDAIGTTGKGKALSTMPPYLAVNYIICYSGSYPSRS